MPCKIHGMIGESSARRMFIRFVMGTEREEARALTGVIRELRLLKESGDLAHYEHDHVEGIFAWLNENYPVRRLGQRSGQRTRFAGSRKTLTE